MMKRKPMLCLALAVALALSALGGGVLAADRAVASTLRLEQTEGTVTVTSRAGKSISPSAGMKLYSGYSLATALKSYGYISLDSTKAVKLDAASEAAVKQADKKLEVDLKSGNLFFNVTAPVGEDESLNIRTSTMVTGIRGTAGFVRVIDEKTSEICLLEGTVSLVSTDPLSGQSRRATLSAGQRATSYIHTEPQEGETVEIVIDSFAEADVPGFVAREIKKDADLQQAITAQTELSVPKIIGGADIRLEADEAGRDALQQEIDQAQAQLDNEKVVDPLFKEEPQGGGGGDDSTPVGAGYTFNGPITLAQLQAALNMGGAPMVTLGPGASVTIGATLTVPAGASLSSLGAITLDSGSVIESYGTIINGGTMALSASSSLLNRSSNTLIVEAEGSVTGSGTIFNGDGATYDGRMVVQGHVACGISNRSGSVTIAGGTVTGTIFNDTGATLSVLEGSTLTGTGFDSLVQNLGTMTVSDSSLTGYNCGDGVIYNAGSLSISSGTITAIPGNGVFMQGGTVAHTDGTVSGRVAIIGGTYTLDGGTITAAGAPGSELVQVKGGTLVVDSGAITNTGDPGCQIAVGTGGQVSGAGAADLLSVAHQLKCSSDGGGSYELCYGGSYTAIIAGFSVDPVTIQVERDMDMAAGILMEDVIIGLGQKVTLDFVDGGTVAFDQDEQGYLYRLIIRKDDITEGTQDGVLTLTGVGNINRVENNGIMNYNSDNFPGTTVTGSGTLNNSGTP